MPISEQYTNRLVIQKLKNLKNVTFDFNEKRLTAIMGVNGSGKSTILHALACCYKPLGDKERKDYKFIDFFPPNTFAMWNDSNFTMDYNYRNGKDFYQNIIVSYQKHERWTPKYSRRPERHVIFFGINSCVPDIENDNSKSFIKLKNKQRTDDVSNQIKTYCSFILDIPYDDLGICDSPSGKQFLGVTRSNIGYCTSLSMGAGEQRVFKIIESALSCPKYTLLLIDEIDLLLHDNALKRLINKLSQIAEDRKLQIIFTTHSILMNDLTEYVSIRYIYQTNQQTLIQTYISSDSIKQLTGEQDRPINIYVEDRLSKAIIDQICFEMGCKRYVSTYIFGAAINAFTVLGGKELDNELSDNTVVVLDGDVYRTKSDRMTQINKVVTGQTEEYIQKREHISKAILQYNLPENIKPEKYIRDIILDLPEDVLPDNDEFKLALKDIGIVDDDHQYLLDAIQRIDIDINVGLSKIIERASKSDKWTQYTCEIRNWLDNRIKKI